MFHHVFHALHSAGRLQGIRLASRARNWGRRVATGPRAAPILPLRVTIITRGALRVTPPCPSGRASCSEVTRSCSQLYLRCLCVCVCVSSVLSSLALTPPPPECFPAPPGDMRIKGVPGHGLLSETSPPGCCSTGPSLKQSPVSSTSRFPSSHELTAPNAGIRKSD